MKRAALIVVLLGGCSILNPKKPAGGGGGSTAAPAGKGWSDIFADAPSFKLGTVEVKAPPCSGNGFLKVEVDEGKPFHVTTTSPSAGNSCTYVEIVNGNTQASGASADVCGETKTLESKGQPGGTYVVVSEKYGCSGITVSLVMAEGPAPAAGAAPAAGGAPAPAPASDGPKPEN